jgi:hypothetical protein
MALRGKIRHMSNPVHPPRTPWGNFPDVLIHASESAVKQHPAYGAAKSGDDGAATDLVLTCLNLDQVVALNQLVAGKRPTLVSAHAMERHGVNAIPEVLADELGRMLEWPVDTGIVQVNVVSHTGANGFWRLARQAEFDGPVQAGLRLRLGGRLRWHGRHAGQSEGAHRNAGR